LSFRDVEDLLAERGIAVSYETVRRWANHFGPMIAASLRSAARRAAETQNKMATKSVPIAKDFVSQRTRKARSPLSGLSSFY
jgi:transposase-like protein